MQRICHALLSKSLRLTFDEKWNNLVPTEDKNRTLQWNLSRDKNVDSCCREFFSAVLKIDLISPTDIRVRNQEKTFPPRPFCAVCIIGRWRGGRERGMERGLVRFNASRPQWFNRSCEAMWRNRSNAFMRVLLWELGLWILPFPRRLV